MADVAASDSVEIGFDNRISAANQTLTLHPPANPCHALNKMGLAMKCSPMFQDGYPARWKRRWQSLFAPSWYFGQGRARQWHGYTCS
jgi:hypothetical protein